MKIKDVIFCWDFIIAIIISIATYIIIPIHLQGSFVKDIYSMGISVLSIIFSVYFAALAIIISSGDDDFVKFLNSEGHYQAIISTFKYSIFMIFVALLYSLGLFIYVSFALSKNTNYTQSYAFFVSYIFIFAYSMFCVFNSTIDSIRYSSYRIRYLKIKD